MLLHAALVGGHFMMLTDDDGVQTIKWQKQR